MSKSLDRVLQPDGSYKWGEIELIHSTAVVEPAEVCPAPEPVVEAEVVDHMDFTTMTKAQLEDYGRTIGIELDKRHTKTELISELETFIESK